MDSRDQIQLLEGVREIDPFSRKLEIINRYPLFSSGIEILQINLGKRCNMRCKHCHVEAGPNRTEVMSKRTLDRCLEIIEEHNIQTVDITGGSPEMNDNLPGFVEKVSKLKRRLIVRSNLTVLFEEGYEKYYDIYCANKVELVASLPDYNRERVEKQRGTGTFNKVITAIRKLNNLGYGKDGSELVLDLMHNPVGAFLPGNQETLEKEYKDRLYKDFGIRFNKLFCLINCPVGRYLDYLVRTDNYEDYMAELCRAYNPGTADNVMCRTTLSVGWDGRLYDCDFNQMLEMPVNHGAPNHIQDFDIKKLANRQIEVSNHCYACTAGSGSSCQGSTN